MFGISSLGILMTTGGFFRHPSRTEQTAHPPRLAIRYLIVGILVLLAIVFSDRSIGAEKTGLPGIKGVDNREINDNTAYPWSAIGRVNRSTGGFCTGAAISSRSVLTAAHCLWNKRTQGWLPVESLHFVTGYRRGEFLANARVVALRVSPSFKTPPRHNPDPADDWAVLTLDRDIDAVTNPLPIIRLEESDLARYRKLGARFVQAGYSQDKAHILTIHDDCTVLGIGKESRMLFHDCDATHGDSGSPILVRILDQYSVIGIHVGNAEFAGRMVGISATASQSIER